MVNPNFISTNDFLDYLHESARIIETDIRDSVWKRGYLDALFDVMDAIVNSKSIYNEVIL